MSENSLTQSGARGPVATLRDLLGRSREQIALALPRHMSPERIIRVALTAFQKSPELMNCDLTSVLGCVIQASQLGLELDGILGHAYMVPFHNRKAGRREAQLIVGYKGYLALARRSGEVSSFAAHVVHANDRFHYRYGSDPLLIHEPVLVNAGEPVAVYAVLRLRFGGFDFDVLSWPKVLECQQKYARRDRQGRPYGPWIDHLEEMARKTAIRALAKRCPVSVELQRAASLDEAAEAGIPSAAGEASAVLGRTESVAAQLRGRVSASGEQLEALALLSKDLPQGTAQTLLAEYGVSTSRDLTQEQAQELLERLRALDEANDTGEPPE